MKIILLGKYKTNEWKKIDEADNKDDMDFLEEEHKTQHGQGWMFKQVVEE